MTGSSARPRWMRASADVDLAQLRGSVRPVMRSQLVDRADRHEVRRWARRQGLFAAVDKDGFFSIAPIAGSARRVLRIDARAGRHTIALGLALGYPACCCMAAGRRNDEGLDDWGQAIASRRFVGLFRLIDPSGYSEGRTRISHVPCSTRCAASLRMARALIPQRPDGGRASRRGARRTVAVRPARP